MMAKTRAKERIIELYIDLANKYKTKDEQIIFENIEPYCLPIIEDSPKFYYALHEKRAKVGFTTFYYRYASLGYSKWDALSMTLDQAKSIGAKKQSRAMKQRYQIKNDTEQDIIAFIKNDLPLNPRQIKYIESNTEFAERLKKEGIC